MDNKMEEYLKLNRIRKAYDGKVAVDDLSLDVPAGSIYGIIGPNGAGKTTTIRMIMDIIAPDSGEILIEGKKPGNDFKNNVGYLPEERGLHKKMTLEEVIVFFAELKGANRKEIYSDIDPWLKRMSLSEYRNRKVEELSKGMQQKLQFVTTMIHKPKLIILDELFSGLDPINIELIKNILLEEKRRGTTILFSTHVMEQAEKLCDYICLINKGKKVLDGRMAEIKTRFGTDTIQVEMEGDGAFAAHSRYPDSPRTRLGILARTGTESPLSSATRNANGLRRRRTAVQQRALLFPELARILGRKTNGLGRPSRRHCLLGNRREQHRAQQSDAARIHFGVRVRGWTSDGPRSV